MKGRWQCLYTALAPQPPCHHLGLRVPLDCCGALSPRAAALR